MKAVIRVKAIVEDLGKVIPGLDFNNYDSRVLRYGLEMLVVDKMLNLLGRDARVGVDIELDNDTPKKELRLDEWISVDDRLPEENVAVMAYAPKRDQIFVGYYSPSGNSCSRSWYLLTSKGSHQTMPQKVTHWMSLPQPPTPTPPDSKECNQ